MNTAHRFLEKVHEISDEIEGLKEENKRLRNIVRLGCAVAKHIDDEVHHSSSSKRRKVSQVEAGRLY